MTKFLNSFSIFLDGQIYTVVWEVRYAVPGNKGTCGKCRHPLHDQKRTLFILVPEGTNLRRKSFFVISGCNSCSKEIEQLLMSNFQDFEGSEAGPITDNSVEDILKKLHLNFRSLI